MEHPPPAAPEQGASDGRSQSPEGAGARFASKERIASVLFGLVIFALSARSLWLGLDDLVRSIAAGLGILAGVLFMIRRPQRRAGSLSASAIAVPSVIVGGVLVARAYGAPIPPFAWVCLSIGGLFSAWAIASLGRSFAILPSARNVVEHGPFRWVRHPGYAGQLVMLIGVMVVQRGHWVDLLLFVFAAAWMGARAVVEERVLSADPVYAAYTERVRWRVLPGVW